jgi:hypothetical protein
MAKTVYEGFQAYLARLSPSSIEVDNRKGHKRTIEQALAAEFGAFNELLIMGSHTRDTAVHAWSDVDYFAKLGIGDVTRAGGRVRSTTTLDRVKTALAARFPNTEVWIDGPAVVVGFGKGAGAVDVVPGVWIGTTSTTPQYPVFEIPDGEGWWRPSSPQRHSKYLRDEDERSRYQLSKTIRLLKAWKYARAPKVPISGFHLEMLLAAEGTCVGAKRYQECLLDVFRLLRDRGGRAVNDPVGVAGRISATATEVQREALVAHATHAVDKTVSAINAEIEGRTDDAFYYWKLVFNHEFPSR